MASLVLRRWLSAASTSPPLRYKYAVNIALPPAPKEPVTEALLRGRGLMAHINKSLPTPNARQLIETLFSRRHPDRLQPGSVITVHLTQQPTLFSGVLISVRHKGPATSFTLRNVVNRIGTELTFFVGSPHLKKIDIIQRAGSGGGKIGRRMRRNKLYYLRDSPEKMSAISAGISK